MSGGVDSSIALTLLKNAGYEVIGVSLRYDSWGCSRKENVCCSEESFNLAKRIAESFGCQYLQVDVRKLFAKEVIGYFENELKSNRTPSPCVFCNPRVKFFSLLKVADQLGAEYVATGHYARVSQQQVFGKNQFTLKKAKDKEKDQSYSLSFLTQNILTKVIFPLGELTKKEVYELAGKYNEFKPYQKIKQSQDFCFLGPEDYKNFIKAEIKPQSGPIVDSNDNLLGQHEGLAYYTLGQRKGLRLPGGPYFVLKKIKSNKLIVSKVKDDLFSHKSILKPFNFINSPDHAVLSVSAKNRSSESLHKATLTIGKNFLEIKFNQGQILTPGQICVFYIKDICLGAGVIDTAL